LRRAWQPPVDPSTEVNRVNALYMPEPFEAGLMVLTA